MLFLLFLSVFTVVSSEKRRVITYTSTYNISSTDEFWVETIDPFRERLISSGIYTEKQRTDLYDFCYIYFKLIFNVDPTEGKVNPYDGSVDINGTIYYSYANQYIIVSDTNQTYPLSDVILYEFGYGLHYSDGVAMCTDFVLWDIGGNVILDDIASVSQYKSYYAKIVTEVYEKPYSGYNTQRITVVDNRVRLDGNILLASNI